MSEVLTEDRKPRVIAGFGRSGTTWVQDVLAASNSLRAVFEPLHPDVFHDAGSHAHAYRNSGDEDTALYEFLQKYFSENFHSLWVDYRIRLDLLAPRFGDPNSWGQNKRYLRRIRESGKNYFLYRTQRRFDQRIVKLVRANMMLSWLKEKWGARIVFLIRHPAAIVLSQMKSPSIWKPQFRIASYRTDSRLLDELNASTRKLLFEELDDIEAVTLSWCIENTIAFRQAKEQEICVVYYEHLVEKGLPEWRRMMTALSLEVVPDADLISRPSQQTSGDQALDRDLVSQYASWMTRIDDNTAARIQKVLDATKCGIYRIDQALPLMDL